MKNTYSISEVSKMVGMHPNTIRLYEEVKYISGVHRLENNYRLYQQKHIMQLELIQTAFKNRVLSKKVMDKIKDILLCSGQDEYDSAVQNCHVCEEYIEEEQKRINDVVKESHRLMLESCKEAKNTLVVKRKEAAKIIGISVDVLRNWERNSLVQIEKDQYGCNIYTENSLNFLKAVKLLRSVGFSIMSIINMRDYYRGGDEKELRNALEVTVSEDEIYYTDYLLSSLTSLKKVLPEMRTQLEEIKKVSNSTPPLKSVLE